MTQAEKDIIRKALQNYEITIKDDLTQSEHTSEEVQAAFDEWNTVTKLINKYRK